MLIKLLKYDLKYMIKNMLAFYILAVFFAITTRLLFELDQSIIINIIHNMSLGCTYAMIVNILINTMIRSWVRFNDSLYKDESYLTHTLPVSKKDLYNSKFIQSLIFYAIGFIVILISLLIVHYSKENWQAITNYIKTITIGLNMSTGFFVSMTVIVIFLEVFNAIQCGFFGLILGHKQNNNIIPYSIFFGFLAYLIAQSIVLSLVFIFGLFDSSVMELFKTTTINIDVNAFKTLAIVSSILYVIIIFSMSVMCKKMLNKGVNVE